MSPREGLEFRLFFIYCPPLSKVWLLDLICYISCTFLKYFLWYLAIMSDIVARLKEEEGQRGVTSLSKLNVTCALVFDSHSHILQGLNTDFLLAAYLWVPWFACLWQPIMDLAKILTVLNGNAEIWLLANSYFLYLLCMCLHFFVHPLPIFLLCNVSLFSSLLSLVFFLFCMLLPSLAWHGDWKPPKVWRNCKSQKQPAQQPCKWSRNCKDWKKSCTF